MEDDLKTVLKTILGNQRCVMQGVAELLHVAGGNNSIAFANMLDVRIGHTQATEEWLKRR